MDDNLPLLPPRSLGAIAMRLALLRDIQLAQVELCGIMARSRLCLVSLLGVALMEQCGYALAEGFCLRPAAICERGVVGGG